MASQSGTKIGLIALGFWATAVMAIQFGVSNSSFAQTWPSPTTAQAGKPPTNREVLQQDFNFQLRTMPEALQKRLRGLQSYCQERDSEINFIENFASFADLDGDQRPELLISLTNACITPTIWFCEEDGSCQFEVWTSADLINWRRVLVRNVFGVVPIEDGTRINLQLITSGKECLQSGANEGLCSTIAQMKFGRFYFDPPKKLPSTHQ